MILVSFRRENSVLQVNVFFGGRLHDATHPGVSKQTANCKLNKLSSEVRLCRPS